MENRSVYIVTSVDRSDPWEPYYSKVGVYQTNPYEGYSEDQLDEIGIEVEEWELQP